MFTADEIQTDPILKYFSYEDLKEPMREISHTFAGVAAYIITNCPRNAERIVALRKLLEAKDAAVRAVVP